MTPALPRKGHRHLGLKCGVDAAEDHGGQPGQQLPRGNGICTTIGRGAKMGRTGTARVRWSRVEEPSCSLSWPEQQISAIAGFAQRDSLMHNSRGNISRHVCGLSFSKSLASLSNDDNVSPGKPAACRSNVGGNSTPRKFGVLAI